MYVKHFPLNEEKSGWRKARNDKKRMKKGGAAKIPPHRPNVIPNPQKADYLKADYLRVTFAPSASIFF